jgi:hypothetical protein
VLLTQVNNETTLRRICLVFMESTRGHPKYAKNNNHRKKINRAVRTGQKTDNENHQYKDNHRTTQKLKIPRSWLSHRLSNHRDNQIQKRQQQNKSDNVTDENRGLYLFEFWTGNKFHCIFVVGFT